VGLVTPAPYPFFFGREYVYVSPSCARLSEGLCLPFSKNDLLIADAFQIAVASPPQNAHSLLSPLWSVEDSPFPPVSFLASLSSVPMPLLPPPSPPPLNLGEFAYRPIVVNFIFDTLIGLDFLECFFHFCVPVSLHSFPLHSVCFPYSKRKIPLMFFSHYPLSRGSLSTSGLKNVPVTPSFRRLHYATSFPLFFPISFPISPQ